MIDHGKSLRIRTVAVSVTLAITSILLTGMLVRPAWAGDIAAQAADSCLESPTGELSTARTVAASDLFAALLSSEIEAQPARQAPLPKTSSPLYLAQTKLESCLDCCARKLNDCNKQEGYTGRCDVQYHNCLSHCRSHGATPANWSCWGS